ncbi:hypothetical protein LZ31DRAFT_555489 [Colletotrichum somersetense]|nr:hypothetical protein LZ31DRAFT_555489 [Colletotrichum somersetense]
MVSLKSIFTAACLVQFGSAALICSGFAIGNNKVCRISKDSCDLNGDPECPNNEPPPPPSRI